MLLKRDTNTYFPINIHGFHMVDFIYKLFVLLKLYKHNLYCTIGKMCSFGGNFRGFLFFLGMTTGTVCVCEETRTTASCISFCISVMLLCSVGLLSSSSIPDSKSSQIEFSSLMQINFAFLSPYSFIINLEMKKNFD